MVNVIRLRNTKGVSEPHFKAFAERIITDSACKTHLDVSGSVPWAEVPN